MYELEEIKNFIKEIIADATGEDVDDDTLLFDEEILDSMTILGLIGELEEHFDVELPPDEVIEDNYATVEAMADYILSKL